VTGTAFKDHIGRSHIYRVSSKGLCCPDRAEVYSGVSAPAKMCQPWTHVFPFLSSLSLPHHKRGGWQWVEGGKFRLGQGSSGLAVSQLDGRFHNGSILPGASGL
jgi:hypothetical protein